MNTDKFSLPALLRITARRHGLSCLALLLMTEVLHYFRHGSFDYTDVRDGLIAVGIFAVIFLWIEYHRMVNGKQDTTDL